MLEQFRDYYRTESSGVYALYLDDNGIIDVFGEENAKKILQKMTNRLLYIGKATHLSDRIENKHLKRARVSTLRRTLASLLNMEFIPVSGKKGLTQENEKIITDWLLKNTSFKILEKNKLKCAIYTRKSTEEGLEQDFNSLDAQREACEAYIKSQQHEGWFLVEKQYNDGGFSGGNLERPALKELFKDIKNNKIDIIVVYKVDRLTRSLLDFAKIVELFDSHEASFVSVTQNFNTTTSMGRLTLNIQ